MLPILLAFLLWAAAEPAPNWALVELAAPQELEWSSLVAGDAAVGPALCWTQGGLASDLPLRWAHGRGHRAGPALAVTARVGAGAGSVPEPWSPSVGQELVAGDADGWFAVRVLGVGSGWVRLEVTRGGAAAELVREPAAASASSIGPSVELAWEAAGGARYDVWREPLARGARSVHLGEVAGGTFRDEAPVSAAVRYRVVRAGSGGPGASALWMHSPLALDQGLRLEPGLALDLLTGASTGSTAHIEVRYASESAVFIEPRGGTLLAGPVDAGWLAPPLVKDGAFGAGSRSTRVDQDLVALLPEGLFVRLAFRARDGEVLLERALGPFGGACIPGAPAAPGLRWRDGRAFLELPALAADAALEDFALAVEHEVGYGTGRWRELLRVPAVFDEVPLADLAEGELERLRVRVVPAWLEGPADEPGASSAASAPIAVLAVDPADAVARSEALDTALARLAAAPYRERQLGRGMLVALGREALPALRQVLEGADAELARNVALVLQAIEQDPSALAGTVLTAYARELGVESKAPAGWLDGDPLQRGRALLAAVRRGARAEGDATWLSDWLGVLAGGDPDHGVARLAALARERPAAGRRLPEGEPLALIPPAGRPVPGRRLDPFADPVQAQAALLAGLDSGQPRAALVELLVAERVGALGHEEGRGGSERLGDALRLIEHHRALGDPILVDAALALVSEPSANLAAWRELAARRLDWPAPVDLGEVRERRRLERASLEDLRMVLGELALAGATYVDVVLPPGRYRAREGTSTWLELDVRGLRLLGEGDTVLEVGLRVLDVDDVVLEELEVEHARGTGLYLAGGSVTLRRVRLAGTDSAATIVGGWLEGTEAELGGLPGQAAAAFSVRMQERCGLLLRDSLLAGGGLLASEESLIYLESSVVEAGERNVVQGVRGGQLVLRDVWLCGSGAGLQGLRGQLEGVLLDVARQPFGAPAAPLDLCPEHVHVTGDDPVQGLGWMRACPLRSTR